MLKIKAIFTVCLFVLPSLVAQSNLKTLNGLLIDETDFKQVSFATVAISKTGKGVTTNELGRFCLRVLPEDSLTIQVLNYEPIKIAVPDSLLDQSGLFIIKLKPLQYEIDEIDVSGEKKVPTELKSDVFQEEPKFYMFFARPAAYIYYYASRRERRKRELIRIMEQEEFMKSFEYVYNSETIQEYSMLEGRELDLCVIYCNSHIDLAANDSDDDVRRKIIMVLSDYFKLKSEN